LITSWSFARPWCRLQSGSSPVGTLPSTPRNTRHDREAAAARSRSPTKLDKPGAPHAPRDHTARPTPSRYVGRTVTRARRARAGGEEVEAPPHSVASAPRSAAYRPGRELGRIRPGTVRSTRGDSGRPPGSPRTGRRDQLVVPLSRPTASATPAERKHRTASATRAERKRLTTGASYGMGGALPRPPAGHFCEACGTESGSTCREARGTDVKLVEQDPGKGC